MHPDSMHGISNNNEDIIYKGKTIEYNTDSNEVPQSNTNNITRDNLNEIKEEDTHPTDKIRERQPNRKYKDYFQYFSSQEGKFEIEEYNSQEAQLIANFSEMFEYKNHDQKGICNTQTYSLNKGLNKFKERVKKQQ